MLGVSKRLGRPDRYAQRQLPRGHSLPTSIYSINITCCQGRASGGAAHICNITNVKIQLSMICIRGEVCLRWSGNADLRTHDIGS